MVISSRIQTCGSGKLQGNKRIKQIARELFKEKFLALKTHTAHFSTFPNSFSNPQ